MAGLIKLDSTTLRLAHPNNKGSRGGILSQSEKLTSRKRKIATSYFWESGKNQPFIYEARESCRVQERFLTAQY